MPHQELSGGLPPTTPDWKAPGVESGAAALALTNPGPAPKEVTPKEAKETPEEGK